MALTAPQPEPDASGRVRHDQPALDALRALAVLAVLTTHVAFQTGTTVHSSLGPLYARLDVGVAIFFVLSGYLLGRPFVSAADPHGPPLRPYAWRRFLRIVPAYVVVVAVAMLALPENAGTSLGDWARHLSFTQIVSPGHLVQGLTQTWSLCTEVAFYVLLPVLAIPLRKAARSGRTNRALAWCALLGLLNVVFLIGVSAHGWFDPQVTGFWLPSFLSWFALGLAFAIVRGGRDDTAERHRARLESLAQAPLACWVVSAALLLIASTPVAGPFGFEGSPTAGQALTKNVLYAGIALALVLPVAFGPASSRFMRTLSAPIPVYLGEISYAVFLWHLIVLSWALRVTDTPPFSGGFGGILLVTVLGSLLVGSVSLFLVERPAQRLRRLVPKAARASRPEPPAATAPPTAAATSS